MGEARSIIVVNQGLDRIKVAVIVGYSYITGQLGRLLYWVGIAKYFTYITPGIIDTIKKR